MGNDAERVKELEEEIRELNQKLVSASTCTPRRVFAMRLDAFFCPGALMSLPWSGCVC